MHFVWNGKKHRGRLANVSTKTAKTRAAQGFSEPNRAETFSEREGCFCILMIDIIKLYCITL